MKNITYTENRFKLLTVKEAAELAGVTWFTITTWHRKGLLKHAVIENTRPRFNYGDVVKLTHSVCPVCGNGFKKKSLRSQYCGRACRERALRLYNRDKQREHRAKIKK